MKTRRPGENSPGLFFYGAQRFHRQSRGKGIRQAFIRVKFVAEHDGIRVQVDTSDALSSPRTGDSRARSRGDAAGDARPQRDGRAVSGHVRGGIPAARARRSARALPRTASDHPPRGHSGDGAAHRVVAAETLESERDGAGHKRPKRRRRERRRPRRGKQAKPSMELGIPFLDLFREEFFVALGQWLEWSDEDAEEFWRDLEFYEQLSAPAARVRSAAHARQKETCRGRSWTAWGCCSIPR